MNALYAALGWVAALFSTLLLEWNRDSRLSKSLRKALYFELHEFRFRMAGVVFMLATRADTLSPERIAWLITEFETYKGFQSIGGILETLYVVRDHPIEAREVATRFALQLQQGSPGLKKYPTPALDTAVASVSIFTPVEQRQILELRTLVSNLDSATDEAWRFFEMSFNAGLPPESRRRVDINLETAYTQATNLCQRIAQHIASMLQAA